MRYIFFGLMVLSFLFVSQSLWACESCVLVYMGKKDKREADKNHTLTAKIFYENQNWKEIPALEAHNLHHDGHHTHNKQDEQTIHTMLDVQVTDRLSVDVDIPYVRRHFIEIDSHARLGRNETTEGLGDVTLTGHFRTIHSEEKTFAFLAGVKFPTGSTKEENSGDERVEPELQPGTGSFDYLAGFHGGIYHNDLDFSANIIYVYKTEGDQDFRFGDVLSVSLFGGRKFTLKDNWRLRTGMLVNNQLEKKQNDRSGDLKDSGGYIMLVGPQVTLERDRISADISYLTPAIQNLGGAHQELTGIMAGSVSVKF